MSAFANFIPVLAATDAATVDGKERKNGVTEFPCEEPSEKELSDWLDTNLPILRQMFGALLRNETPANLVQMLRDSVDNAVSSIEKLLDEHETNKRGFVS